MKNSTILLIFFTLVLSASFHPARNGNTEVTWMDIEQVQQVTIDTPKKVFIDFTAKWCGWCKVMDKKTFTDAAVISYLNENYYAVRLDFDSKDVFNYLGKDYTAKQLAEANGITGLPTMLVASADFKNVEKIIGYQKPKQFINQLKKLDD